MLLEPVCVPLAALTNTPTLPLVVSAPHALAVTFPMTSNRLARSVLPASTKIAVLAFAAQTAPLLRPVPTEQDSVRLALLGNILTLTRLAPASRVLLVLALLAALALLARLVLSRVPVPACARIVPRATTATPRTLSAFRALRVLPLTPEWLLELNNASSVRSASIPMPLHRSCVLLARMASSQRWLRIPASLRLALLL